MQKTSRRTFIKAAAVGAAVAITKTSDSIASAPSHTIRSPPSVSAIGNRVEPWIEVSPTALRHNVETISAYTQDSSVLAVLKCNAYGMGPETVAPYIDGMTELSGFAVAKTAEAHAIRDAGALKPIVMLCDPATNDALDLVRRNVALCTDSIESRTRLRDMSKRIGHRIPIHLKIDTGLGRLGIPLHQADEWIAGLIADDYVSIHGIFCSLPEVPERTVSQLSSFRALVGRLRMRGYNIGKAHAAASFEIANIRGSALDMVRPGLMCYGSMPDGATNAAISLTVCHRLRGRVTRVTRLNVGDGVGYSQKFIATTPVWTASIMCGWSDGYTFPPLHGTEILINDQLYPVIGLTANTTVVNLGAGGAAPIREGVAATLIGPEYGLRPNDLAAKTDGSEYNQIKYAATLPKFIAV